MAVVVSAVVTAFEVGTVASVLTAVSYVGLATTVVGAVTGNKNLMKIGGEIGLVGGIGGLVNGAIGGAASAGANAVGGGAVDAASGGLNAVGGGALDSAVTGAANAAGSIGADEAAALTGADMGAGVSSDVTNATGVLGSATSPSTGIMGQTAGGGMGGDISSGTGFGGGSGGSGMSAGTDLLSNNPSATSPVSQTDPLSSATGNTTGTSLPTPDPSLNPPAAVTSPVSSPVSTVDANGNLSITDQTASPTTPVTPDTSTPSSTATTTNNSSPSFGSIDGKQYYHDAAFDTAGNMGYALPNSGAYQPTFMDKLSSAWGGLSPTTKAELFKAGLSIPGGILNQQNAQAKLDLEKQGLALQQSRFAYANNIPHFGIMSSVRGK